jgi:hypothetical protein
MAVQNNRACEDAAFPESKRRAPRSTRPRNRRRRHDSVVLSQRRSYFSAERAGRRRRPPPRTVGLGAMNQQDNRLGSWHIMTMKRRGSGQSRHLPAAGSLYIAAGENAFLIDRELLASWVLDRAESDASDDQFPRVGATPILTGVRI